MATRKAGGTSSAAKTTRKTAAKVETAQEGAPPALTETPAAPVVVLPLPADGVTLKKKELIDLVVARSGVRKREVKPVIEAALSILGDALAEGRELNLQPLGKLKVKRMKKGGNGQIINARVRQPEDANARPAPETGGEIGADEPLAPAAE